MAPFNFRSSALAYVGYVQFAVLISRCAGFEGYAAASQTHGASASTAVSTLCPLAAQVTAAKAQADAKKEAAVAHAMATLEAGYDLWLSGLKPELCVAKNSCVFFG